MHRWKVGLAPAERARRKRRRRMLVAERRVRRRERSVARALSRAKLSALTPAAPLDVGPALIVILLLSLGLWAMIWATVALAVTILG